MHIKHSEARSVVCISEKEREEKRKDRPETADTHTKQRGRSLGYMKTDYNYQPMSKGIWIEKRGKIRTFARPCGNPAALVVLKS
jgi:hypothetical protein